MEAFNSGKEVDAGENHQAEKGDLDALQVQEQLLDALFTDS